MPFHFVQVQLRIFRRLFSVLVPFVFHSVYMKATRPFIAYCGYGVEYELTIP
jgi:hypothetical protein